MLQLYFHFFFLLRLHPTRDSFIFSTLLCHFSLLRWFLFILDKFHAQKVGMFIWRVFSLCCTMFRVDVHELAEVFLLWNKRFDISWNSLAFLQLKLIDLQSYSIEFILKSQENIFHFNICLNRSKQPRSLHELKQRKSSFIHVCSPVITRPIFMVLINPKWVSQWNKLGCVIMTCFDFLFFLCLLSTLLESLSIPFCALVVPSSKFMFIIISSFLLFCFFAFSL